MFKKLKNWLSKHRIHKWEYYKKLNKEHQMLYYLRECKVCGKLQMMAHLGNSKYVPYTYHDVGNKESWLFAWEYEWYQNSVLYTEED